MLAHLSHKVMYKKVLSKISSSSSLVTMPDGSHAENTSLLASSAYSIGRVVTA